MLVWRSTYIEGVFKVQLISGAPCCPSDLRTLLEMIHISDTWPKEFCGLQLRASSDHRPCICCGPVLSYPRPMLTTGECGDKYIVPGIAPIANVDTAMIVLPYTYATQPRTCKWLDMREHWIYEQGKDSEIPVHLQLFAAAPLHASR